MNSLVHTPFGAFPSDQVHKHPPGSVITRLDDGSAHILHPDGNERVIPGVEEPRLYIPAPAGLPIQHAWLNYASFYTDGGVEVGRFNADYTVPGTPSDTSGSVLYYFTGIQDMGSSPLTILQPVLGFNGNGASGWSLSSWNCCPGGQPHQSNTITGIQSGDTIQTSIVKTGDTTYTTEATWQGQTASLAVNTGSEFFNWPNVTLEVYNISVCQQFAVGAMTFSNIELLDTNGDPIPLNWDVSGDGAACSTEVNIVSATEITIEQNA